MVCEVRFIKSVMVNIPDGNKELAYHEAKKKIPAGIPLEKAYNMVHIVTSEQFNKEMYSNEIDITGNEDTEFDGELREVRWDSGTGQIFGDLIDGQTVELIFNPQYQTYKDKLNGAIYDASEAKICEV